MFDYIVRLDEISNVIFDIHNGRDVAFHVPIDFPNYSLDVCPNLSLSLYTYSLLLTLTPELIPYPLHRHIAVNYSHTHNSISSYKDSPKHPSFLQTKNVIILIYLLTNAILHHLVAPPLSLFLQFTYCLLFLLLLIVLG